MKPKQFVELSDLTSRLESKNTTGAYNPLRYQLDRVGTIDNDQGKFEIGFTTVGDIITILDVDGKKQILVLKREKDFEPKNRKEAIDNNEMFLFMEPEGEWGYNDLKFTQSLTNDENKLEYGLEFQLLGDYQETPTRSGLTDLFAGFSQYNVKSVDTFLFIAIFELGNLESEEGGLITLYKGRQIKEMEIKYI